MPVLDGAVEGGIRNDVHPFSTQPSASRWESLSLWPSSGTHRDGRTHCSSFYVQQRAEAPWRVREGATQEKARHS